MKFPHRRQFLHLAAGAAVLPAASRVAWAQAYPSRPVRWIIGFPAGGGADTVARIVGPWLSERLGQQVVVENRPGASSNIAVQAVVNSPPDGYTLLFYGASALVNTITFASLPFDLRRDIVPVCGLVAYPMVLVAHPSAPAKTVAELIAQLAPDDRFHFFSASLKDRYPRLEWPGNARLVDRRLPVHVLNFTWNRLRWPALDRLVSVLALNRQAGDLGRLIGDEARSIRRDVHRELVETIERRGQQVWIPVTVATLVPGVIFLAVPFVEALRLFANT